MNLGVHLKRSMKRFPDRVAIVDYDTGKRFTYTQLNERLNRLANGLFGLGLKKGDRVALLMNNCHQAVESDAALYSTGLIKLPLNARLSAREKIQQINNSDSIALIFHPSFMKEIMDIRSEIPGVKHFIVTSDGPADALDYEKLLAGSSAAEPVVDVGLDDIYWLQYTSGTSGVLKAAILTHRNALVKVRSNLLIRGEAPPERVVFAFIAPVTHAAANYLLPTIVQGGTLLLLNPNPFTPKTMLEIIEKERVTDIYLIPVMINMLLDYPDLKKHDYSSLCTIVYGTAPLAPERIRQALEVFGPVMRQGYGLTESAAMGTILNKEDHITGDDPVRLKRLASAGFPAFDTEVRVVDEKDKDLPPGEVGEVIMRGDFVMKGYWKDLELTAETIRDGWLHTGDMGMFDEGGYLYLTDRKKDMIISGGFNIYPNEVENALVEHPAVFEAVVVGVPDDKWGEAVKALVVLRSGAKATEEELIEHCRERLASYKKPKSVEFVKSIPRNATGKVLRRLVREPYWQGKTRRVN